MKNIAHSNPTIGDQEAAAAADVIRSGQLAYAKECRLFEEELAIAVGRKHAVVMANGHAALEIYLESLNLPENSPVLIPSYVCSALRHSVHRAHMKPKVVDVDKDTLGLGLVGPNKGAAIAAHIFAVPCRGVASEGYVLEDCAMGFVPGKTGQCSHASLLSFYATKMLTAGQGGCLLTDDDNLAEEWRSLLQYDNQESYRAVGNRQLSDVHAAIGRVQLTKYPTFLNQRKDLFALYQKLLNERELLLHPMVGQAEDDILFRLPLLVEAKDRDPLISHLKKNGIEAKKPIWRPLHVELHKNDTDFPVSTEADVKIVSLPFYPSLRAEQVLWVVDKVKEYFVMAS